MSADFVRGTLGSAWGRAGWMGTFGFVAAWAVLLPESRAAEVFTYAENFNDYDRFDVPIGWTTQDANVPNLPPAVFTADPVVWAQQASGTGGVVNYNVAWSGGGRFTLIHPSETPSNTWRAASAWYDGNPGPHLGDYPLNLQQGSLKVEFDLVIRSGKSCMGDGMTFALQPVTDLPADLTRVGVNGGGLGWAGLNGLAVEFDVYGNGPDPTGLDGNNHIGLDVSVLYASGSDLPSLVTHLDPPASLSEGVLPRLWQVSDNNQPVHVTVFYNDPAQGGVGVLRVYAKVDPATKQPGEPGVAVSFGMEPQYAPHGRLVSEVCIGPWPTAGAIFGFTGATGGCDAILSLDNIAVKVNSPASGTPCVPDAIEPPYEASDVPLDPAGRVAACNDAGLTAPGWEVRTYKPAPFSLRDLKDAIWVQDTFGPGPLGSANAEPDLNYDDGGCGGEFPLSRPFPGLSGSGHDDFGMIATGWICFPQAGDYLLAVRSDDGFEIALGTGSTDQVVLAYDGGRGCDNDPAIARVQVASPGVYPIRVLYFEGASGAGIELYRIKLDNFYLLRPTLLLVGASTGGYTDQPVVYSRRNGQPAPDGDLTPIPVMLAGSSKTTGTPTGSAGVRIKTITPPAGLTCTYTRNDDGDAIARGYLDVMNDRSGNATAATINFRDLNGDLSPQYDGQIAGGIAFPGVTGDHFAMRARGYATFPTTGTYYLWLQHDDNCRLTLGPQVIYASAGGGSAVVALHVQQAGTYLLRLDHIEGDGQAHVELGQFLPANGALVALGNTGAGSTISLATDLSGGAPGDTVLAPAGPTLPANRRVALVGQGTNAGWNALLSRFQTVTGGSTTNFQINRTGLGTLLIEDDFVDFPPNSFPSGTDSPADVNYVDTGENPGDDRFNSDRSISVFGGPVNGAGGNDDLAVRMTGYVEFPMAGDYALGFGADDGATLWVGGRIVTVWPTVSGPQDATPAIVHVEAAGLYDIRADFHERGGGMSFELFEYLPDGTRALINSAASRVKVYRTLSVTPSSTAYANPVRIPATASLAGLGTGIDPGLRVQLVQRSFPEGGNGHRTEGGDLLRNLYQAGDLLNAVIPPATSHPNQTGSLLADAVVPVVSFANAGEYPGSPAGDDFAVRVSGFIELTAGGHLFEVVSDNGFDFWLGGENPPVDGWHIGRSPALQGATSVYFYASVASDGMYAFTLQHFDRDAGEQLTLSEVVRDLGGALVPLVLNGDNESSRVYTDLVTCQDPFADVDDDGDVDQDDFGLWQRCSQGAGAGTPSDDLYCQCLDRTGDQKIDSSDLPDFIHCADLGGPAIPADPGCD